MGKEKRDDSTLRKKKQKTDQARRAAPISMTQEEVDALVAGDIKAQRQIAKRLRVVVPSEVPLRAKGGQISDKASPPRITRAEMAEIKRLGRVPRKLLKRFERRAARYEPITRKLEVQKAQPEQPPSS